MGAERRVRARSPVQAFHARTKKEQPMKLLGLCILGGLLIGWAVLTSWFPVPLRPGTSWNGVPDGVTKQLEQIGEQGAR